MTLAYERKNAWEVIDEAEKEKLMAYSERYKAFLDKAKTEREAATEIIRQAKENGFISLEEAIDKKSLAKGSKIYLDNMGKSVVLMVLGNDIKEGMKIVGSHIDSPRLDIKANPLYEESNLALLKTHYYGGVKKYQWTCIPLAIHGVIFNEKGEKKEVNLGEDENDPVLYINDLLIHLSADQLKKTMAEGITAEQLNVVLGHSSFGAEKESKNKVKDNILKMLNEKYDIVEEDFQVAELEIVPAGKARDVGMDRSMIAAHGHDDRVCTYAGLEAIFKVENPEITCAAIFADKEEVGSIGATGMEGYFFENMVAQIIAESENNAFLLARKSLAKSKILSADVSCAFDPAFPEAFEKLNSSYSGCGITVSKYTGARGKGGCNDANAEFLQYVRKTFKDYGVVYQTGELGKTDQGGGGTIAFILARYGAEVLDCGTPMLSMHAPIELLSKADAYMTNKAYEAFFLA